MTNGTVPAVPIGGWKTKVGGGLAIFVGVAGYALGFLGFEGLSGEVALGFIAGGFTAIGLGHKFEKLKAAIASLRK